MQGQVYVDPNTGMQYTNQPVMMQQPMQPQPMMVQQQPVMMQTPVQQTTTTYAPQQPAQVIVVQQSPAQAANEALISWILFGVGFFTLGCFLWIPGAIVGLRSKVQQYHIVQNISNV